MKEQEYTTYVGGRQSGEWEPLELTRLNPVRHNTINRSPLCPQLSRPLNKQLGLYENTTNRDFFNIPLTTTTSHNFDPTYLLALSLYHNLTPWYVPRQGNSFLSALSSRPPCVSPTLRGSPRPEDRERRSEVGLLMRCCLAGWFFDWGASLRV